MNFRSAILFVSLAIGLVLASPGPWLAHAQGNPPPTEPHRWRNVSILGGGFVTGITFSPAEEGLVYARTDIGGAYRWDALGKQWVPLTDWVGWSDSNLLGIESLASDPSDPDRLYLAAGTYTQSWAGRGAILRSTDRGRTWLRTDMPFKMGGNEDGRSIGERLAVDPNDGSRLYFGSRHDWLWRSTDYGASWAKVSSFPTTGQFQPNGVGIGFVLFDSRSGSPGQPSNTIYAASGQLPNSLYRSTDTGETWHPVPGQPQSFPFQVDPPVPHHAAFDSAGVLYVTYCNGPGPNGVTGGRSGNSTPRPGRGPGSLPRSPVSSAGPGLPSIPPTPAR